MNSFFLYPDDDKYNLIEISVMNNNINKASSMKRFTTAFRFIGKIKHLQSLKQNKNHKGDKYDHYFNII